MFKFSFYQILLKQNKIKIILMSLTNKNKCRNITYNCFTLDTSPKNQLFKATSDEVGSDLKSFIPLKSNRAIVKSAQKAGEFQRLKQLKTRSFHKKKNNQQAQANLSTYLPLNKTTLQKYESLEKSQQQKNMQKEKKDKQKLTLQKIRSQRDNFKNQTKRLQNSYHYLLNQVKKCKKKSLQKAQRLQRLKQIQQQSKKEKLQISTQITQFIEEESLQKSRLRETVITQKKQKQKKIVDFYNHLHENATIIRFQSNQIEKQILQEEISQVKQKKAKYLEEKSQEKKRLEMREKNLQSKIMLAQHEFKMKWLREFNQSSEARRKYMKRKQMLGKKIQRLYEEVSANNTLEAKRKRSIKSRNKSLVQFIRHQPNPQVQN